MYNSIVIIVLALVAAVSLALVFVLFFRHKRAEELSGERILSLTAENASLHSKIEAQQEAARLAKEQKEADMNNMKEMFKSASLENSNLLRNQNASSIAEILKPIQDKFAEFDKTVRESQIKSAEQTASMKSSLEAVMKQSQTVGEEAKNLANALTGYSKVQGDFGEMLLTDVLKSSGLQEGVHFLTQSVITDERGHEVKSESGRTMIPDVIVLYPDDTVVIVDSKLSLNAYHRFMTTEVVEERRRYAKEHVESLKKHVDELKKKDYASQIPSGKSKVNYNIMFVPMEGAFRLMLEQDPLLWQVAKDNGVLIVSQMTLTIVLNMIQMSWRQYNQEKNIEEVYNTAGELMSRINAWLDSFVKVGDLLTKLDKAYETSKRTLVESNQSVVKKIDKLEKLGITTKRSGGKIKTGGRMVLGQESVIPKELMEGSSLSDEINEE